METIYRLGQQIDSMFRICGGVHEPNDWSHPPECFKRVTRAGEKAREIMRALQSQAEKRQLSETELATLDGLGPKVRNWLPHGLDYHGMLCGFITDWVKEFPLYEARLKTIPDGWVEMSEMLWGLEDYCQDPIPPRTKPRLKEELGAMLAIRELRLDRAKMLADSWKAVWPKLLPWLRSGAGLKEEPPAKTPEKPPLTKMEQLAEKFREGLAFVSVAEVDKVWHRTCRLVVIARELNKILGDPDGKKKGWKVGVREKVDEPQGLVRKSVTKK
jgi:hypothetical protein